MVKDHKGKEKGVTRDYGRRMIYAGGTQGSFAEKGGAEP